MSTERNLKIAAIFKEMAAIYKYIGIEERFRALSYNKAARVIGSLQEDVSFYISNKTLEELPGIGKSIAEKIIEFTKTGKIKTFEQLKKNAPHELIEMMDIKGFGPRSLKRIQEELNISTKQEMINALKENKIETLKGFGKKKAEGMLRGLKLHKTIEDRLLLWDALSAGNKVVEQLKKIPEVTQISLAGSLRRKKETVGDIDILVACDQKHRKKIISAFTAPNFAKEILAKGDTKASILLNGIQRQADLRIVSTEEWGSALLYFTGSKEHNIHLRTIAKEMGYKISEYGLFELRNDMRIAGKTEEEIYHKLGFQYIPPEMREDKGELGLAAKNKIPKLVTQEDMMGDLHLHSNWSDGFHNIEEIAKYVLKNFHYKYIALTDHSKSSRVAKGMDEKHVLNQIAEIRKVNKTIGHDFVKAGIEVDILLNGTLDLSDEILSQLDWVTAAIHSNFNQDNTLRLIKACENPYVNCIAHPTGRLIGKREAYAVDIKKVIDSAKKTGTALEINAQPDRMDLNDELAAMAREKKVKLVIATDSHTFDNFNFMELGVSIARRAGCTSDDILNTKSWKEIENFKQNKKSLFKLS